MSISWLKSSKDNKSFRMFKNLGFDVFEINDLDKTDEMPNFTVYIVWMCKTLQNSKALLSTSLSDGMYYELTMNGDKKEIYLDAYKKFENKCIKIED